jgi:hypothetical protein
MRTVILLVLSNIFMTFAWYGHLKRHNSSPLWLAILVSWGIAFFEYCLMVPANRIGYRRFSLPQLKVIQEVVTLVVFGVFAVVWMRERLHLNHLWAGLCLVGAVFFTFRN